VAGKKVSSSAVRRNKIKRRLRHLLAATYERLPHNAWIVFMALPGAAVVNFEELEKDYNKLIGCICAPKSGYNPNKAV
jgi:ribonuclease P protein component